jgi:hypothetical protein
LHPNENASIVRNISGIDDKDKAIEFLLNGE